MDVPFAPESELCWGLTIYRRFDRISRTNGVLEISTKADEVTLGSGKSPWWRCKTGHEWQTAVNNRTNQVTGGTFCPKCSLAQTSRREQGICSPIAAHYRTQYEGPQLVPGCRGAVDLAIHTHMIAIEYDGWYWHKDCAARDNKKTSLLQAAGWTVIRIRESHRGRKLPPVAGIPIEAQLDDPCGSVAERVIDLIEKIACHEHSPGAVTETL
ncbi:DUF559 domain-containing protein [Rhodococcus opacus]|nr:DUF559 domain-containing protein [Rhodococcus opacus]